MLIPVILAGGSGTRLWPLSRELYPKQLLSLVGEHSLLQSTCLRVAQMIKPTSIIIVCNQQHRFLVAQQINELKLDCKATIILESVGKNTAPAVALAGFYVAPDDDLLILPADHVFEMDQCFVDLTNHLCQQITNEKLITFGIKPTHPETGYGYIIKGTEIESGVFGVKQFKEKPDYAVAEAYIQKGSAYWNSGMFLFKARHYLAELRQYAPEIFNAVDTAMRNASQDLDFIRPDSAAWQTSPSDSIDYAVMEKTQQAVVVPIDNQWSDIGSFDALYEIEEKDEHGNVTSGDIVIHNVKNCLLRSESQLIAAAGIQDLMIVEVSGAILVVPRTQGQNVKALVAKLKAEHQQHLQMHTRVYRPWGYFENLLLTETTKVKILVINPGASLSLQSHQHRSEHWVVIEGVAKVVLNEEEFHLSHGQSIDIPKLAKHRIANEVNASLKIIEVQAGEYLGEDDIVRYDDIYGRREYNQEAALSA